jgi:hypothetical protein
MNHQSPSLTLAMQAQAPVSEASPAQVFPAQASLAQPSKPPHRPFIDPMTIDAGWYWLLVPLSLCISVAYKAIRVHDIRTLPRQALAMTLQLILGIIAIGALGYIVIEKLLPLIAPIKD